MQGLNLSQPGLRHDPEWYRTAVFYEVLVRAFSDSKGSGSGDFRGLIDRLDYLQWLGIDCLWLPPFYASPAARRRVRHRRLHGGAARVRHPARVQRAGRAGARPRHPHRHRPRDEPHQRPAPVVPGVAHRPRGPVRRLLRVVRHRRPVHRRAHHLRRHRDVELDVRPDPPAVLLAPVLPPPARPELREPARSERRCSTSSGSGWTSASTGSGSTPSRTSSRRRAPTARTSPDARVPRRAARDGRRGVPRPHPAGRGEPAPGRGRRLLRHRGGAGVPDVLPLPGHAAALLLAARGAGGADHRRPRRHPGHPDRAPSGARSCATTTS